MANIVRELTDKRSLNAKHYVLDDSKRVMRVHGRPLHYVDLQGKWQDIDLAIAADSSVPGFTHAVTKAPYHFRFARTSVQPQRFALPGSGSVTYRAQGVNPVQATITGSTAIYANAWNDVDLVMTAAPWGVKEVLVIKAPTGGVMTWTWEVQVSGWTAEVWNGGLRFLEGANPVARVNRPKVEGEDRYGAFALRQQGGKTYLDLSLDTVGLVGPVRLDPTTSYYSTASDGTIRNFGTVYATVQAATDGTTADSTSAYWNVGQNFSSPNYYLDRMFFYFNTSDLGASATISAAILYFYLQTDGSTTDFNITVVQGTQADPMTTADFDSCGTTSGGTLTTVGISTVAYSSITLNATGLTWINKTGTTLLALRSDRDIAATAPAGTEYVAIYFSEQTGTANDPYIDITYTVPAAPQMLV